MTRDKDIREPLFDFLEDTFGRIRILEEKNMGKSRADIIMVAPSCLYGIEIKSDADTYTRLSKQVRNYNRFFDYNILVVGSTHAAHAMEHVPDNWGIISVEELDGKLDFYELRSPKITKAKLKTQLQLLWRRELAQIQATNHLHKYAGKSRKFVEEYILTTLDPDTLKKQLLDTLFERDYTIFDD